MRTVRACLAAALALGSAAPAQAGWYLSPAIKWAAFASRPEADEPTPNYYGYGGTFSLGYSAKQAVDFGLFGSYVPGARGQASFGKDDASLVSYGGEFGLRIAEDVYFGLRGGTSTYHLYGAAAEHELPGEWEGPSGGFSIGAVGKVSKQSFVQTTLDVMHHVLTPVDDEVESGKRRFDSFSVSFAYVFNRFDSSLIQTTIFKDFLNSTIF